MSYGLSISNPTGELVVSSEARGANCIGKFALKGSVVQFTGNATTGDCGYSTYTLAGPQDILIAMDLPANRRVGILAATWTAGVHEIIVHCGDTPDSVSGFDHQYALDVWGFAAPTSPPTNYGLAMWDAAGNLTHDFGYSVPLFPVAFADPYTFGPQTIPTLTRPVLVGVNHNWQVDAVYRPGPDAYDNTYSAWCYKRGPTNVLSQDKAVIRHFRDAGSDAGAVIAKCPCFIIEGNLLP